MRAFRREGDRFVAEMEAGERDVLATVVSDVAELLGIGERLETWEPVHPDGEDHDVDGPGRPDWARMAHLPYRTPEDPAVRRLLPDASRDDREVAREFRRLTEDDLRREKALRLVEVYRALIADDVDPATGERYRSRQSDTAVVRVRAHRAPAFAAALTDIRLVLGERLGVTDEEASAALEDEVVHAYPAADDHAAQARHYLGSVFLALGWWQETLMACLLAELPDAPDGSGRDEPGRDDPRTGLGSGS